LFASEDVSLEGLLLTPSNVPRGQRVAMAPGKYDTGQYKCSRMGTHPQTTVVAEDFRFFIRFYQVGENAAVKFSV